LNLIADVGGALKAAGVDDGTIDDIKKILAENQTLIHSDRPVTSTAGSFGGSSAGAYFDTQATIAHQHVEDALTEMVEGLGIYRANLASFQKGMATADANQQEAFGQVQSNVENAEDFTTRGDFHDRDGA
jgi:uncharacterized protein YukE